MIREQNKDKFPGCGRCSHPGPLHSKDGVPGPCTNPSCHGGPDNEPCPGFISQEDWAVRKDQDELKELSDAIDEERAARDPRMASEAMQERARELREQIEAEMTAERVTMAVRAAAGLAVIIAAVVIIRRVRRRGQD